MDVIKFWFFNGLEYVYGEYFFEYLSLEGAIVFLNNVWKSLKFGGVIWFFIFFIEWVFFIYFNLLEINL